ncbi:MAG: cysteine desulfurase-like protein [Cyclobacteriaceae bacterium]
MSRNHLKNCQKDFPSLAHHPNVLHLDGPAGTQVPQAVMDAMNDYYIKANANTHGYFAATKETDHILAEVRRKMAALLAAEGPHTISFGQNMTTLNYSLSRAIARGLKAGDEIVITQLDHEANRGPWLGLEEQGIVVKELPLLPSGTLDYAAIDDTITERAKLVAIGLASNALGTINEIAPIRARAKKVGAWLLLDAVHYAPHLLLDVQALDCDFLLCSAYKFYGPHVGILYSRPGLLDTIDTDRLATQDQVAPYKIETGTLNHAAIAGVGAAVDYMAGFGQGDDLRSQIVNAMSFINAHEFGLAKKLYQGLSEIPGLTLFGPTFDDHLRAPTIAFTLNGWRPEQVCSALDQSDIYAWDGHFYALRAIEILGLLEQGGVTRMGISIYNTEHETDKVIAIVTNLAQSAPVAVANHN